MSEKMVKLQYKTMFYNFQIVKVREDYNLQLQENIEK